MNDPLKKFVQENREAFDHLEPDAEVAERLWARLGHTTQERIIPVKRSLRTVWWAAAALVVGVIGTYAILERRQPAGSDELARISPASIGHVTPDRPETLVQPETDAQPADEGPVVTAAADHPQTVIREKAPPRTRTLAARLSDSTSASARLAAILEIEESGQMNEKTVELLTATLNHDGNTNVRLAALDVLSRYLYHPAVANRLATALATQDDPLVQLGLIKVVEPLEHRAVDSMLFALANSPSTFAAVKDEAYAVLLRHNKL